MISIFIIRGIYNEYKQNNNVKSSKYISFLFNSKSGFDQFSLGNARISLDECRTFNNNEKC